MKSVKMLSIVALLAAPIVLSGCSLLGLGGPPPLCEDQAVKNYVQTLGDQNEKAVDAGDRFAELMSRLQNDSSLIDSSTWQDAVNAELQKIIDASQQVQNMSAPRQELGVAHELFVGAYSDYEQGATTIREGLQQNNAQTISDGSQTLQEGNNKISGARDELNSVLSSCQWY